MPRRLDAIVQKLLRKDPAQRYASAAELEEDLENLEAPVAAVPQKVTTTDSKPSIKSKWPRAALAVVLLLLAAGLAWWKFRPTPAPPPQNAAAPAAAPTSQTKDSIIVADFVNHTGDPVFDTTLNQALQIELEQSPVLNIVSPEHLTQSVKYLGKPEGTMVTPQIAREIGEREGIKAIITGTIANLGREYVITLTAQNTVTGDEIVSEQAQAPDKEHVLDALGKAASALRGKLGEDLESIKKLDTPFGQATTTSLEAFRAYALGDKAHAGAHDIPEAEGHFLRAVELDPNFAMAYARLGVVYINSGQVAKANRYFAKAYELSKNVSERERLYISGHYQQNVTGNLQKVVEILQEAIQAYPSQIANYINISVTYQLLGQYDQALAYAGKAVALDAQDSIAAENLLADLTSLRRIDEARTELERIRNAGLTSSTGDLVAQMTTYYLLDEPQQTLALLSQVAGKPDEFTATQMWAAMQQYSGQFRSAKATIQKAVEQAGRAKAPDVQAGALLADATARGLANLCEGNEEEVKHALALDKTKQTLVAATLAAGVCGNGKLALPLVEDLSKKYPEDTLIQDVYGPLTRAFVALAAGRLQEAIDAAEPAKSNDANFPASYLQGLAYLKMHDAARAQTAFQTALRANSGTLQQSFQPFYGQVQLGSAQAYLMAGDKANAKKTYEAFFKTWKNADADLPMLVAAKKDYSTL
jgi:tetratricopeptide (TPR) repeat protein